MDHLRIVAELEREFPGRPITCLCGGRTAMPEEDPTEIIVEIERTANPDQSVAIAVIDRSEPHVHEQTYEVYEVLEGALDMYLDEVAATFWPNEQVSISPGVKHWAEGNATWVRVTATPAWTPDDHRIIK